MFFVFFFLSNLPVQIHAVENDNLTGKNLNKDQKQKEAEQTSGQKLKQGINQTRTLYREDGSLRFFALYLLRNDFGLKRPIAPRDPTNEGASFKKRIN